MEAPAHSRGRGQMRFEVEDRYWRDTKNTRISDFYDCEKNPLRCYVTTSKHAETQHAKITDASDSP